MSRIIRLVINNIRITLNKRSSILVYIILPVIIAVLSYRLLSLNSNGKTTIAFVQNDKSYIVSDYIKLLKKSSDIKIMSDKKARKMVSDQDVDCAVILPKDFTKSVYENKIKKIVLLSIKGSEVTAWTQSYTNSFLSNLSNIADASNGDKKEFAKIYSNYKTQNLKLISRSAKDLSNRKNSVTLSMGFLIMFILSGATSTANAILKEKKKRTFYRICSAPVTATQYLLSNVIANFLIVLAQISLVSVISIKVLKLDMGMSALDMFTIMSIFGLVAVGFGLLIVSFSNTTSQVSTLSSIVITTTCMLSGCWWPVDVMPKVLQKAANFLPQKWTIEALLKVQDGNSLSSVTNQLMIIVVFALVFFAIAVYKLKKNDDVRNVV